MDFQTQNNALVDLLRALLNEAFAVEQNFSTLTLTEIGELIEETRDHFESPDALTDGLITQMESFEKCKSTYCLILLELELQNGTFLPTETVGELVASSPDSTSVSIDEDEDTMSEKTMIRMGISTLESHAEQIEEDFPILEPIAPMLSHEPDPSPAKWSEAAGKFTRLTEQLKEWRTTSLEEINSAVLDRVIAQNLCWALECELLHKLKSTLIVFWPTRSENITPLLVQGDRGIELTSELKETLELKASNYPQWLYEARFPTQGIVTSLRYFLSVPEVEKLNPAPLDLAGLIFFFGQDRLRLGGLSKEQLIELSFRLTRIQRLKAKILSPHQEWDESAFHRLEEDVNACILLVFKLSCEDTGALQAVA